MIYKNETKIQFDLLNFIETKKNMKINGYENLNFVKWAGGKGHLINQIEQYLPKKIDRYFEPFIGGGAVFFYIMQKYKPKFACISDINQNLIITYDFAEGEGRLHSTIVYT